ncbi:MAG: hypothetical protein ACF8TS_04775 [Maioricimonas sp. JB049]
MRAEIPVCVILCLLVAGGCEQEPVNPGVEVLENPPSEVNLSHTRAVKIEINGQDLSEGVTVRQGEPIQVTGTVDVDDSAFESPHVFGNVHIRMLPVGTEEDAWGSWKYAMEWVTTATKELSYSGKVDAPPGEYEARAYMVIGGMLEEVPTFDLLVKSTVTVEGS